jgi:hypothetical protein
MQDNFLFSLKSNAFWPILIAHLFLHDFLHLFIWYADNTVRPLTLYSTKIATVAQIPLEKTTFVELQSKCG